MGKLPNITGIREHWTALARDLGGINRRESLDRVEAVRAEIGKLLGRIQVGKEPGKAIARLGLLNQGYINRELVVAGRASRPIDTVSLWSRRVGIAF